MPHLPDDSEADPVGETKPTLPAITRGAAPDRRMLPTERYVEAIRAGDRVLLSQAITLVESRRADHLERAEEIVNGCLPYAGRSVRVGVTGVPGVGKSTFIEALGTLLTGRGRRVAVLAVDPSSRRSHGSILGDKTRMERLAADPNAYIRPSPTSGSLGGVTRTTRETIVLCEAAGYDVVIVETVGVGQSEIAVHGLVDFFLLLALTGAGDDLQGMKRGIMEMVDAIAVTKADGANAAPARRARSLFEQALALFPPGPAGWKPPVHACSALSGDGIDEIWATVEEHQRLMKAAGAFDARRREQARQGMIDTIERMLLDDFYGDAGVRRLLPGARQALEERTVSPSAAARRLLRAYRGGDADGTSAGDLT